MERKVEPEILDSLPEGDPAARANRRDIRRINSIMGNYRWFRRQLRPLLQEEDTVLELGAGAGDLGLYLDRRQAGPPGGMTGLDRCSRPESWPTKWHWVQEDLMDFCRIRDYPVVVVNLLLHQFSDAALRELGRRLGGTNRVLLCVEPARRRIHQWQLQLLTPFGLHRVSRHDGRISIAAGFLGHELPWLLGLKADDWRIHIETTFLGAYRMTAVRRLAARRAGDHSTQTRSTSPRPR